MITGEMTKEDTGAVGKGLTAAAIIAATLFGIAALVAAISLL